ncbi:type II toxin-antitoxin system HicB family antitoxin [Alkalicoccobacillus plakortidis]|uniref:Type II toxin-antitoxin system HicB family antitoxin n=1 Tax=Alkalicoccobacillus plakortidis TaxID=444060 RepID=A0ABT0XHH6_9BACI|nr:type II toxin-antitoxin system HicB family antitoxin [Alkalicoccobacillus plakortidis]MCM2675339.1 type II toxin-antitoxin system HicB family antitoxin [Alkalicoccobacillus plakortidis]
MRTGSDLHYYQVRPEDFTWYLRQVPNWFGNKEYMIELEGIDGCVSFGDTVKEAKKGLQDALSLWLKRYGEEALPLHQHEGAQLIHILPEMSNLEVQYINEELQKLI